MVFHAFHATRITASILYWGYIVLATDYYPTKYILLVSRLTFVCFHILFVHVYEYLLTLHRRLWPNNHGTVLYGSYLPSQ